MAELSRVTQTFCLGCTAQGAVIELASLEILPSGAAMAPSKLRRAFLADAEGGMKVGLAAPTCSTASLTWFISFALPALMVFARYVLCLPWTGRRVGQPVGTDPSADPVAETKGARWNAARLSFRSSPSDRHQCDKSWGFGGLAPNRETLLLPLLSIVLNSSPLGLLGGACARPSCQGTASLDRTFRRVRQPHSRPSPTSASPRSTPPSRDLCL